MKKDFFFFLAAQRGHKEIVEALISSDRVDLNKKGVRANTALILGILLFHLNRIIISFVFQASKNNQQVIAEKLLNAGANPNIMDNEGGTAFSWGKIHFFCVLLIRVKKIALPYIVSLG